MVSVVVVGTQWGDEGKGKIIDFLASQASMVVRCQGGNNAGHTVVYDGNTYKLHLVPSGILYQDVSCVIANGVVVDIGSLLEEIDMLHEHGFSTDNLILSDRAQIIMPYHYEMDAMQESMKGADKIGTTKKGIGPAYEDKIARSGIRICDLMNWSAFEKKVRYNLKEKNALFSLYNIPALDAESILETFAGYAERIRPYIKDTSPIINAALDIGEKVLFEGAQGTLLDVDHGTYPYVTSSHPIAGGACTGAGVGPTKINRVVGIAKAYATRVGDGPFPSERFDATADLIREIGNEYGATTGRPRRCGWFDVPAAKYSAMINGLTDMVLTKLDIFDDFDEISICVAYEYEGTRLDSIPADLEVLAACRPIIKSVSGWKSPTGACRSYDELPQAAQDYIVMLEQLIGVPISIIATGCEREKTIIRNDLFA